MAQPIPTRTARRGRCTLRDRARAGGRGREADHHPRNRQARLEADRCSRYRLAQDPLEPQDFARNRVRTARNWRIAATLRTREADMTTHEIGTREKWLKARLELL